MKSAIVREIVFVTITRKEVRRIYPDILGCFLSKKPAYIFLGWGLKCLRLYPVRFGQTNESEPLTESQKSKDDVKAESFVYPGTSSDETC